MPYTTLQVATSPQSGPDTTLAPGPTPLGQTAPLGSEPFPICTGPDLTLPGLGTSLAAHSRVQHPKKAQTSEPVPACSWAVSRSPALRGTAVTLLQLTANHIVLEAHISTWLLHMCCATLVAVPSCSLFTANQPYSNWSSHFCPKLWMGTVLCLVHLHKKCCKGRCCQTLPATHWCLVPVPMCPHQTQPGVDPQMEVSICLVSVMSHQLPQGCSALQSLVGNYLLAKTFPPTRAVPWGQGGN